MSLHKALAFVAFIASAGLGPAQAVQPDEVLPDPGLESRARALSSELRCLVCQNQSIDDSAAPLARDLRLIVRERLKAGDSDDAVKGYLVRRYGEFILLKPPFESQTLLLWSTPVLVLLLGFAAVWRARAQGRGGAVETPALSQAEEERLAALTREPPRG